MNMSFHNLAQFYPLKRFAILICPLLFASLWLMTSPAAELNPQSPLAPLLKNYRAELATQRVVLPNLTFVMPRQERPGNAWDEYQKAATATTLAIAQNPEIRNASPSTLLLNPEIQKAALDFYNATRMQKFDTAGLLVPAASFVESEERLNKTLDVLDGMAAMMRQVGRDQLAARNFNNATDNAQTQLAMGWHWLSMPMNTRMIEDGFRYLEEGLKAMEEINKAAARPDLENRVREAIKQLAIQREVWRWKGDLLRKFLPSEHPETLLIIRDDMMADADPAFHLYAMEYLNELMRQALNQTPEPATGITLDAAQRRSLRSFFAAERTAIRRLGEQFETSRVPGITFQALQMKELAAKMN